MKFIDLFAGLGGFHLALKQLGHECVFASEIDEDLRKLYQTNFNMMPIGDIRDVKVDDIPKHDILCAGFPCQPFSKAGPQNGFEYPELGGLYENILKIVEKYHPRYLLLENVPNLQKHNKGRTWSHIDSLLRIKGYDVRIDRLSPHYFGIPQIRERVYIVAGYGENSLSNYSAPTPTGINQTSSIDDYLDVNPANTRKIPENVNECLDVWQEFLDQVPRDEKIPHPLWSMEFGATYPYKKKTPSRMTAKALRRYKGSFGQPLSFRYDLRSLLELLPSHARRDEEVFPNWKINFITKNRSFYRKHQSWLDDWIPKIRRFPSSLQKLEWNCQSEKDRHIRSYIIQIRPSGVRVKRRTTAPSLVAMTTTQVPIIAWESRYMTLNECKRLQSMDGENGLKALPKSECKAYEALGNAINVQVAKLVIKALIGDLTEPPYSIACVEQRDSSNNINYKKEQEAV